MNERLIPAHAGKTRASVGPVVTVTAHPRSRGENFAKSLPAFCPMGSSPLTRGKRRHGLFARVRERLIPAHAGKTTSREPNRADTWAHPRSRGENVLAAPMIVLIWGSSPLTRGKRPKANRLANDLGLIPAHAGKTL